MKKINKKNIQKIIVALVIAVATFFYILTGDEDVLFWQNDTKNEHIEQTHHVTRVIDGDTFVIETGERVRMIGIDTPEQGQIYYQEAKEHLKDLINDQDVRLEMDRSQVDRYGRLLRHVYIDDMWINEIMIKEGYARFATFPPDVAHVDAFRIGEKEAREKKRGLWGIDDSK